MPYRQLLCAILCAIFLSGCAGSVEQSAESHSADYQAWVGRSITDFTAETGQTPDEAFVNERGEKVFVFRNPFIPGRSCKTIKATRDGKIWVISEIRVWCAI